MDSRGWDEQMSNIEQFLIAKRSRQRQVEDGTRIAASQPPVALLAASELDVRRLSQGFRKGGYSECPTSVSRYVHRRLDPMRIHSIH